MTPPSDKPSVLITGANGFIGSRMVMHFLVQNFHVIAGVRKTSDLSMLNNLDIEYRYGDVTQPETLPAMVGGVDYVVHNAGLVKAKKSELLYTVNEQGTRNLCETVAQHNPTVKKLVCISSLAAGGPSLDGQPVKETDSPHPLTEYGRSKLAGEKVALSFADRLPIVCVRPPGVYGPGDKEIFGFFQTLNSRIKPKLGDQSRALQLVHVDDLVRGVCLAATSNTKSGSVYFIAESTVYSFGELVQHLKEASGKSAIPIPIPAALFKTIAFCSEMVFKLVGATPMLTREKADELLASWAIDTSRAREELGFESAIPFPEGARQTYDWYRKEGWL